MVYHLTSLDSRLRWIQYIVLIGLLGAASPSLVAASDDAQTTQNRAVVRVEAFHKSLLQAADLAEHASRESLLQSNVIETFNLPRIAAISLGRTWRTLSEVQQSAFVELLTSLVVATYADRFNSNSGQQFVTDKVEAVKSGFVVHTRLVRQDADDVSLNYFLRDGRVFNVVADGVSDLSLRRADYNSIIKSQGYDALLTHIEEKIQLARGRQ